MEMEKVTQNLGAVMPEQSQQGLTATQMMASGLSFEDIIMAMIGSKQDNAGALISSQMFNSEMTEQTNLQNAFADILKFMTPELMKGIQNSTLSEYNISEFMNFSDNDLFNLQNFDENLSYSDNIIKADPLQLAGLLDYIGTGIGIPSAAEILAGNESIDSNVIEGLTDVSNLKTSFSGANQFDPEQMLKSGEMEIISYVPASSESYGSQSASGNGANEALEFYRTMNSVKENVKAEEAKTAGISENTVNFNVEDMNKYAQNIDISFDRAAAETSMNKLEYEPADRQLLRGITENLDKEKSEFTVKLKPEGLGEILVKLVQNNEGKMLLSMVASSAKTAELLNRDLALLQSSLNQLNVEIVNKSVDVAENVMPMTSVFDQYDERRQDEGRQQNQFRNLKSKINSVSVKNVSFDTESIPEQNVILDQALDITI